MSGFFGQLIGAGSGNPVAFGQFNCNIGDNVSELDSTSVGMDSVLRQFSGQYLITFTPDFFDGNSVVAVMAMPVYTNDAQFCNCVAEPSAINVSIYVKDINGDLINPDDDVLVSVIAVST